jgi:hypothetical protein
LATVDSFNREAVEAAVFYAEQAAARVLYDLGVLRRRADSLAEEAIAEVIEDWGNDAMDLSERWCFCI